MNKRTTGKHKDIMSDSVSDLGDPTSTIDPVTALAYISSFWNKFPTYRNNPIVTQKVN